MTKKALIIPILLTALIGCTGKTWASEENSEAVLYINEEVVRVNPYTNVAASVIGERVSHPALIREEVWRAASQMTIYNESTSIVRQTRIKNQLSSSSIGIEGKMVYSCEESNSDCLVHLAHSPLSLSKVSSAENNEVEISLYDDLGIRLFHKKSEAPHHDLPGDFFLQKHFYARYDHKNERVQGVMREGRYFDEMKIDLVIQNQDEQTTTSYMLHPGQMFEYDLPTDVGLIAVKATGQFSPQHHYEAIYRLWDEGDPFFSRPSDRWSAILSKQLLHNDMGVSH